MGSYNGLIAQTTLTSFNGISYTNAVDTVPSKLFKTAVFSARVSTQVGGTMSINVVGAVGGATFIIAGVTGIRATGNYIMGITASATYLTPRPIYVQWAGGISTLFSARVFIAGDY